MKQETHLHKCGFPYHETEGCGEIWEHESNPDATYDQYVAAHTCPKCGKAMPMFAGHFWQFDTKVVEVTKEMPEPAFELLAILNTLPDTIAA